jgi:hypothetical protein
VSPIIQGPCSTWHMMHDQQSILFMSYRLRLSTTSHPLIRHFISILIQTNDICTRKLLAYFFRKVGTESSLWLVKMQGRRAMVRCSLQLFPSREILWRKKSRRKWIRDLHSIVCPLRTTSFESWSMIWVLPAVINHFQVILLKWSIFGASNVDALR